MFPENHYYYKLDIQEDISLQNVSVVFARPSEQAATSPIVFSTPPNIITPLPGTIFSRASDDVIVTFEADSITPRSLGLQETPCSRTVFPSDDMTTTMILPAATNNCQAYEVTLSVARSWESTLDPALHQEWLHTVAYIHREVAVQYMP